MRPTPNSTQSTPLGSEPAPTLISPGQRFVIDGIGALHVGPVTQRNWSRVATATSDDGRQWFCKQSVDRLGRAHPKGFAGELETRQSLADTVGAGLEVTPVSACVKDDLLLVQPHLELTTIDTIGSVSDATIIEVGRVGEALAALLESRRAADDPDLVHVWKGLDPKNIAWDDSDRLWIFDFGPPTTLPMDIAAARVIAAGLLSRWAARPRVHVIWPERDLLRSVCTPLSRLTRPELIDDSLRQSFELRMNEPQRAGLLSAATLVGLSTAGRCHWAVARREARRLYRS